MMEKRRPILSLDDRKLIEKFVKEGRTYAFMAYTLKRSDAGIKREIRANGGRNGYNAEESYRQYLLRIQNQSRNRLKPITHEQVEKIKEAYDNKWSLSKIMEFSGTTRSQLSEYFRQNYLGCSTPGDFSYAERIDALEQQINLIFEILKEVKNGQ